MSFSYGYTMTVWDCVRELAMKVWLTSGRLSIIRHFMFKKTRKHIKVNVIFNVHLIFFVSTNLQRKTWHFWVYMKRLKLETNHSGLKLNLSKCTVCAVTKNVTWTDTLPWHNTVTNTSPVPAWAITNCVLKFMISNPKVASNS